MWTKEARIQHASREERYPSDVTDTEWAIIAPMIPPQRQGVGHRETDMREVMNAVRYVCVRDANGGSCRKIFHRAPPSTIIFGSGRATGQPPLGGPG